MKLLEITPFSWRLPVDSPYWRHPPRSTEMQDICYLSQFDYSTIWYDVFYSAMNELVIAVGPSLRNIREFYENSNFSIRSNSSSIKTVPVIDQIDRCDRHYFSVPNGKWNIINIKGPLGEYRIPIGENLCNLFQGKKVLFSRQKNNKLEWIVDWINIYKNLHDINALLLFDNNSDVYSSQELLQYISAYVDIDVCCVVHFPFLYGPQGGTYNKKLASIYKEGVPWDSDYLDYGILEVAHQRFLATAKSVVFCDIDEIIIGRDDINIPSILQGKNNAYIIKEHLVTFVRSTNQDNQNLSNLFNSRSIFFNPLFLLIPNPEHITKWIHAAHSVHIRDQYLVHSIAHGNSCLKNVCDKLVARHFFQVSTGWKYSSRLDIPYYDSNKHLLDCEYIKAMHGNIRSLRDNTYPIKEILHFARSIGACPHPKPELRPDNPAFDCSICPWRV